jgi:glycosyltransferase involved in cell wall biosynthesis
LDRSRFDPILCCMYDPGEFGEELSRLGCRIYGNLSASTRDIRGIFRLKRILQREAVDLVYMTDGFANMIVGRLAAALARTPASVLAFHTYDTIIRQGTRPLRRAALELADLVFHPTMDRYIALAPSHKAYLVETKRLKADKIRVVPNGIELAEFESSPGREEARRAFGIDPTARVVVMVAGLRRWKDHAMLLRAAPKVIEQVPDALFVLAGDGPERAGLEEAARGLRIADRVRFLGVIGNVPQLLAAADLCVLTSRHEAFPLSLLEAMACGLPVVATATGSVADLVDDGVTGWLVGTGDASAFAAAVVRLLDDPTTARAFGRAGRSRVEEEFTMTRMVSRTEAVFVDALGPLDEPTG